MFDKRVWFNFLWVKWRSFFSGTRLKRPAAVNGWFITATVFLQNFFNICLLSFKFSAAHNHGDLCDTTLLLCMSLIIASELKYTNYMAWMSSLQLSSSIIISVFTSKQNVFSLIYRSPLDYDEKLHNIYGSLTTATFVMYASEKVNNPEDDPECRV